MTSLEESRRLLEAWRSIRTTSRAARALALAALAAGVQPELAAGWPLGARNAWMLGLVRALGGPRLELVGACRACGQRIELTADVGTLEHECRASLAEPAPHTELACAGRVFRCRAVTGGDVLALEQDPSAGEADLLARVIGSTPADAGSLPDESRLQLQDAAAALDPWATVRLDIRCPACGFRADEPLPIVEAAWNALEHAAASLVRDVHMLATAYGWTEDQVLSLPKWRRDLYAEMARA